VRQAERYDEVAVGYLRGSPSIEEAAAHITSDSVRLYPLFMSNGYYVSEAIPKRLGISDGVDALGHHITIQEPLGLHPELPQLLLAAAIDAAAGKSILPKSAALLLVAHGSAHSPHSAAAARQVRDRMAGRDLFAAVEVAFLEEEPLFVPSLKSCPRPTFVLGLFAGEGMHAGDDIHGAVAALKDPDVHIVEQLGGYAEIIELVAGQLLSKHKR
jgi:sirohydrochlorin cobaltochelatase